MLAGATALPPTPEAPDYWRETGPDFAARFAAFAQRLTTFFPAQRLEITLSLVWNATMAGRRDWPQSAGSSSGRLPGGGGLCGELAAMLDGLLLRLLA